MKGLWLLFHAGNYLEVHPRASYTFWWTLGGSHKISEASLRKIVGETKLTFEEHSTAYRKCS